MHKYVVSLVLLAVLLKYSRFKIHIPVVFDFEQIDTKRNYLEQKIRVENWILHKHFHLAENVSLIGTLALSTTQPLKVLN